MSPSSSSKPETLTVIERFLTLIYLAASGLIYGLLSGKEASEALNYGIAHGALAMTTPGDTSMASLKEVENIISGKGARVQR